MKTNHLSWLKPALKTFLMELIWIIPLTVLMILLIGYLQVNIPLLSEITLTRYADGAEAFWIFLYFLSDILYFIVLILLFVEAILFFLRKMGLTALKGIEAIKQHDFSKAQKVIKAVSLITIAKKFKIITLKRAIITYVAVLIVVFGSGWLAKAVLKATDSLVYRSHEVIHLYHQDQTLDFSNDIEEEFAYDLIIETGMAHVHVYTISDTSEAKLYALYDDETQLLDYEVVKDEIEKTLHIQINLDQIDYERYLDPVVPAIELYLPEALTLSNTTITVASFGSITMEYVAFGNLTMNAKNTDVSIKADELIVGDVAITQIGGTAKIEIDRMNQAFLQLTDVKATIHLSTVEQGVTLQLVQSNLFLYQLTTDTLTVDALRSQLEFREVLGHQLSIKVTKGSLLYVNANQGNETVASIEATDSSVTLRGVVDDSQSDN